MTDKPFRAPYGFSALAPQRTLYGAAILKEEAVFQFYRACAAGVFASNLAAMDRAARLCPAVVSQTQSWEFWLYGGNLTTGLRCLAVENSKGFTQAVDKLTLSRAVARQAYLNTPLPALCSSQSRRRTTDLHCSTKPRIDHDMLFLQYSITPPGCYYKEMLSSL